MKLLRRSYRITAEQDAIVKKMAKEYKVSESRTIRSAIEFAKKFYKGKRER